MGSKCWQKAVNSRYSRATRQRLVVVLRFASTEAAEEWYHSEEYQAALPYRLRAADYRSILVNGE